MTLKPTLAALALALATPALAAPHDYEWLRVHPEELHQTEDNIATLGQIFGAIYAQDWAALRGLYATNYVQHNPDMSDRVDGVIELFSALDFSTLVYEPVMQIAEGPYVIAFSRLQFAPDQPMLGVVDINFVRDGKSREHWDIIQPVTDPEDYGAYRPLEAFSTERIRRQFDTNVIGLLEVTKAMLPHMRANRAGTIVNISSIGGQITFPLGTLYHGTKFAVEGLSEALHYELEPLGIRVRIVQPGMIKTDFGGRSFDFAMDESVANYAPTAAAMGRLFGKLAANPSAPEVAADVIWQAATVSGDRLRFRAGSDAEALLSERKVKDDAAFIGRLKALMAE